MKETILLFHFSDRDKCNKIIRALFPLKMKIREVKREDYLQPLGYLAGMKGILPIEEKYTGEELAGEMLLMAGLSSARIDQALQAMRRSKVGSVPYKAVLTPSNQNWNTLKLFEALQREHEQMSRGREKRDGME